MLFLQMTGLSGAGKSTLATSVKETLTEIGFSVEIIDGDDYRKTLCRDLGFSREDRNENIRRLGFVGIRMAQHGIISIMAAINPYESARLELKKAGPFVKTVWVNCDRETLFRRDTKGLYQKALLPDGHPEKIYNLTGINDPFEEPSNPDLVIHTHEERLATSTNRLLQFILRSINELKKKNGHPAHV